MIKPQEDPNQIVPMSENDQGAWLQNMISPEAIQALGQKQHAERMRKINPNYDPNIEPMAQIQPRQIPMDRERFSEIVFQQMGGDPWMENPKQMALQELISQLPAIWKKVFPNIPWGGRLDDDQMKYWQNVKLQAYNMAVNNFVSANDQKKETYKFAIGEFEKKKLDMEKAGAETKKLSYLRKELEVRKEFEKPSETPSKRREEELEEFKKKETWKSKQKPPKESPEYTLQQQVDDARSFYSLKMRSILDPLGGIREGKEKEYENLMSDLANDLIAINEGRPPSYLKKGGKQTLSTKIEKALKGKKAGKYKIDGEEVKWDGTKIIQ